MPPPESTGAVMTGAVQERRRRVWMALSEIRPAPTLRELAREVGVSHNTVWHDVRWLAGAGYVDPPGAGSRQRGARVRVPLITGIVRPAGAEGCP